jgi:hypothetical protein
MLTFNGDKDTKIEPFRAMLAPRVEDTQDEEDEDE